MTNFSGGGFVVENNNKWFLRGIISSSLLDETGNCDIHNFAVYTDVTKYTSWVQSYMQLYV